MKNLREKILKMDGKSYREYKSIRGKYKYDNFDLDIIHVQGDPFASPSLLNILMDLGRYNYEENLYDNISKKTAFEDYIGRIVNKSIVRNSKGRRGTGKSGAISIYKNSQRIIKRSSVEIKNKKLNINFYMALPASGRRILAKEAIVMFFNELPKIFEIIKKDNIDIEKLKKHIKTNKNADYLRKQLKENGLISFVANDSILARQSGVDNKALKEAVSFQSPKSMEYSLKLANGEIVKGMGIKEGVTVITGGGFHGKSTVLSAIEDGVYNHIPGDGREYVVSDYNSVKVRAEDGRAISNVDISPFINNLPFKKDTKSFSTENASGSTSQAANIVEAIEMGARVLLIDEDTSATNFMMRDAKMQQIIKKEKEPITPFIDRVRSMYGKMGISTIIVVGGLGDYFDVADKIIALDSYRVEDITEKAKKISEEINKYSKNNELDEKEFEIKPRNIDINKATKLFARKDKVKTRGQDDILVGDQNIDIRSVEQLVENGQSNLIAEIIRYIIKNSKDNIKMKNRLENIEKEILDKNISDVLKTSSGNMTFVRKYEVAAAINRIRAEIFLNI